MAEALFRGYGSKCIRVGPQESPGVFNEVTFRALDWLLDEARRHGIRIILSFVDNWKYPGAGPHLVILERDI